MTTGGGPARILIALCGLLRSYRVAWPVLADQLRLDQIEAAGRARVDVIVLTSLRRTCVTNDEQRFGRCAPRLASNLTADELRLEIRATIGPRLRLIHDAEPTYKERSRGFALESRVHGLVRHLARTDKLADQRARRRDEWPEAMSTSLREREVAAARAYFDPYQIIFCVRPDVVLVPPTPLAYERSLGAFDLLRSAAAFPGFQLIGGSVWRKFWYHNRDFDLAHMLSAPARVGDWLGLETKAADRCGAYPGCARQPPVPPPRPPGLSGAWDLRESRAANATQRAHRPKENLCTLPVERWCSRVVYFANRALPMGALPEALAVAHIVRLGADADAPGELTPCVLGALDDECGVLCARKMNASSACRKYVPAALVGRVLPPELRADPRVATPLRRQGGPGDAVRRRFSCDGDGRRAERASAALELGWAAGGNLSAVDWRERACSEREVRFDGPRTEAAVGIGAGPDAASVGEGWLEQDSMASRVRRWLARLATRWLPL